MAQAVEIREEAIGYRGRTVLRAVDFRIEPGERVVIVGKSGAGKSTLLGRIYERACAESALIPQSSALVGPLNVFHNVYMGRLDREPTWRNLVNLVWPLAPCLAEIRTILEIVDLRDQIFEKAGRLSGGQQQRTSIARAMFNGRPILIGDEPVSALDRVQGANLLQELARRHETLDSRAARYPARIGDRHPRHGDRRRTHRARRAGRGIAVARSRAVFRVMKT